MTSYLLRRLFIFLPTFIMLIIVCFFLIDAIPEQRVDQELDSEEVNVAQSSKLYESNYNRIAKQLGLALPSFYFSIRPRNLDGANRVDSYIQRKYHTLWLKDYSQTSVNNFREIVIELGESYQGKEARLIEDLLITPPPRVGNRVDNLKSSLEQRDWATLRSAIPKQGISFLESMPVLRWHGLGNRFHTWLRTMITDGLGRSVSDGRTVLSKIIRALNWTFALGILSLIVAFGIGIPTGLWAARKRGSIAEALVSGFWFLFYAIPVFWFATLMIVFFTTDEYGSWTDIFPTAGLLTVPQSWSPFNLIISNFKFLLLPVLCLSIGSIAFIYRQIRANALDERGRPYFVALMAKGLSEKGTMVKHILRNAIFPLIGLLATIIPGVLAGSLIIEILFNIPGMGRLLYDAVYLKDWNVVLGVTVFSAFITFVSFLLSDVLMYWLNPKLRYEK